MALEQDRYLNKWKENAKAFDSQKCYYWMSQKIFATHRDLILDIGCGDGSGIESMLALNKNPKLKIISIDKNLSCLKETQIKLVSKGYTVELIERLDISYDNTYHKYSFLPIRQLPEKQVTPIQSDLLSDPHLESYLRLVGAFDAITVWLIGTHLERQNCINIFPLNIDADSLYRLCVQNKTYELADKILKMGGILHVVDRGQMPSSEELKQVLIDLHKEQASVTTLDVFELDYIPYREPINKTSIKMRPSNGNPMELSETAMISILARK